MGIAIPSRERRTPVSISIVAAALSLASAAKSAEIVVGFSGEPFPAEFYPDQTDLSHLEVAEDIRCSFTLNGSIGRGDAERLIALYQQEYVAPLAAQVGMLKTTPLLPSREQFYVTLCLDSSGGNWDEGLALGRAIADRSITTVVKADAECYSACALAFMFGTDSTMIGTRSIGHHTPSRYLHYLGSLGFHAPRLGRPPYLAGANEKEFIRLSNMSYSVAISNFRQLTEASIAYSFQGLPVFEDDLLLTIASTAPCPDSETEDNPCIALPVCDTDHMACVEDVGTALGWRLQVFGFGPVPELNSNTALSICNNAALRQTLFNEFGMVQRYEAVEALNGNNANRLLSRRFGGDMFKFFFMPDEPVFGHLGGAQGSSPCFVSSRVLLVGNSVEELDPLFLYPRDLALGGLLDARSNVE